MSCAASTKKYGGMAGMGLGTVATAYGKAYTGNALYGMARSRQMAENYKAAVTDQEAQSERAAATQSAINARLETNYALSSVKARAGSSGASVTSPTIINQVEAPIAATGEFKALNALATGETRARNMEAQAAADRYMGQEYAQEGSYQRTAGIVGGLTSALSGAANLYSKYG